MIEASVPGTPESIVLPPFFDLVTLDSVDSTSSEVVRRADAGAREGLLVWAMRQTQGRGRHGRQWDSPAGNLYCSLLLEPDVDPATAAELGFVLGISIRECIVNLVPANCVVRCKWPNDVLVDGQKIAGVLLEATARQHAIRVVAGIGINLVSHPVETPYPATDLKSVGAENGNPALVLKAVMNAVFQWRETWMRQGFTAVREAWLERAAGLGEAIEVKLSERTLSGTFMSLNDSGALELCDADGIAHTVTAGDVFFPNTLRVVD